MSNGDNTTKGKVVKPIQGKQYLVRPGDSLATISLKLYGNAAKWPNIFNANLTVEKHANKEDVTPGTVLNIPVDPEIAAIRTELSKTKLQNKDKNDLTLLINGHELLVDSCRLLKAVDNAAHVFSAKIRWEPNKTDAINLALAPYQYPNASIYLGGQLKFNGIIYTVTNNLSSSGISKTLEGATFVADVIDSTMKPPYEASNISLLDRVADLVAPFGIKVIDNANENELFDRVTAKPAEKVFQHISKLAAQRGVLITSDEFGNLVLTKAIGIENVGTLNEGGLVVTEWQSKYDGRKRFNAYKAIGQSPSDNALTAVAVDNDIPRTRFMTFKVNETTNGNIQTAADWRRSKQVADSLTIPLPVSSWYAPNGKLWRENTLVTVVAESIHLKNGFTFLIKAVEFMFDNNKISANLSLVPPQVYTGEEIPTIWS